MADPVGVPAGVSCSVHCGGAPLRVPGVGSNRTQPSSSKSRESSMPVTEVSQRVAFVALSAEAAAAIGVQTGSPGMLLESGAMAGREPLYFFESFIPPNARRLDVS